MNPASPFAFDWVAAHAAERPDAPAVGSPDDGWVTYEQLHQLVAAMSSTLAHDGVAPGDRVVLVAPSSAASVAAGLAVQAIGATCVELSRELGTNGWTEVVRQTRAVAAIVAAPVLRGWVPVLEAGEVPRLYLLGDTALPTRLVEALSPLAWSRLPGSSDTVGERGLEAGIEPDDTALLVFTSGSTGAPRGVIQTHANIDANTRAIARYLELDHTDRAMATLPLHYCYGRSVLQTHLLVGASIFFDHRFIYPRIVLQEIGSQRCTGFAGVPLTFESIKRQVDLETLDLSSLRYVTQAGGRMHPETIAWVREAFASAPLFVMYGQTEATARLSYLPPEAADEKAGSVGRPVDNIEVAIVDDAGGPVDSAEVGNVVARGPSITPGYFEAPEETAAILRDGWLWTGDLGYLDADGYLFLVGRTKDFLKLGGHRVGAVEIEEIIASHPDVAAVAVVGITDTERNEQAIAFVTPAVGATVDPQALRRYCRAELPAFKVPKFVRMVDQLPLTATGKIAKAVLEQWIVDDPTLV